MSTISETYADLGGGLGTIDRHASPPRGSRPTVKAPGRVCDAHMFDPVSGWCGCGVRDDGKIAEGSPAWRAQVERVMPQSEAAA